MAKLRVGSAASLLLLLLPAVSGKFLTVYMDSKKGTKYSSDSVRVETSLTQTYSANTNSWVVLSTPDPYPVWYVRIQRFDLEALQAAGGSCHDYFNLFNGATVSSPRLNASPLCGRISGIVTYYTTGRDLTLQFVSDATAEQTGVEVVATAAIRGACTASTGQFLCKNESVCISDTLRCDGFAHCIDASDEATTLCQGITDATDSVFIATVVGSVVGGILLVVVIVVVAVCLVRERERQRLLERLRRQRLEKAARDGPGGLNEYPVTNTYRTNANKPFFVDEDITDKDWGLWQGALYPPVQRDEVVEVKEEQEQAEDVTAVV